LEDLPVLGGIQDLHEGHGGGDFYLFVLKYKLLACDLEVLVFQGLHCLFGIEGLVVEAGGVGLNEADDGIIEPVVQIGSHAWVVADISHHLRLLRMIRLRVG
jgi:hypothetical protein